MLWQTEFVGFETKHWSFPYSVSRRSGHDETFTFQAKGTLFAGLQLVGGDILDEDEWSSRLVEQAEWVINLIFDYRSSLDSGVTGRVVLFAHANPNYKYDDFFDPLTAYIEDDLNNELPILYVNGDDHEWDYKSGFYGQESFLRIMVNGGSSEPPVKLMVDGSSPSTDASEAFLYDRQL